MKGQLGRLAELRGADAGTLARRTTVAESRIQAVLDGAEPDPDMLRELAPVLGLHASDLFVIAGQAVPGDLVPTHPGSSVGVLAWSMTHLPGAVPELHELAKSLPEQRRPLGPPRPAPSHQQYPDGPGALLLRLLHNRGLSWSDAARFLFGLGRGPMLSASTIGAIGHGRKALTPELLTGFAAVIDIPGGDLSALTGNRPDHPRPAGPPGRPRGRGPHLVRPSPHPRAAGTSRRTGPPPAARTRPPARPAAPLPLPRTVTNDQVAPVLAGNRMPLCRTVA